MRCTVTFDLSDEDGINDFLTRLLGTTAVAAPGAEAAKPKGGKGKAAEAPAAAPVAVAPVAAPVVQAAPTPDVFGEAVQPAAAPEPVAAPTNVGGEVDLPQLKVAAKGYMDRHGQDALTTAVKTYGGAETLSAVAKENYANLYAALLQ